MRRHMRVLVAFVCAAAALVATLSAQAPAAGAGQLHTLKVQGNVYMLVGAGGNIALQIGDDGVLLVDTGTTALVNQVVATIRTLTDKPIRYIINTSAAPDHGGGTAD